MLSPLDCFQSHERESVGDRSAREERRWVSPPLQDDSYREKWANTHTSTTFEIDGVTWINDDYSLALSEAQKSGKPIFVDFTGYTCTNCRWIERNMYSQPEVIELLKKYVTVQLHTDRRDDVNRRNRQMQIDRLNSIDLPTFVLFTPEDSLIAVTVFTRDVEKFTTFLKAGLAD